MEGDAFVRPPAACPPTAQQDYSFINIERASLPTVFLPYNTFVKIRTD